MSYDSVAHHNQFLQKVWDMKDREYAQDDAARKAMELGHKESCKWVEILSTRQSMAHESWRDCGEWKRSGREAEWRKKYN